MLFFCPFFEVKIWRKKGGTSIVWDISFRTWRRWLSGFGTYHRRFCNFRYHVVVWRIFWRKRGAENTCRVMLDDFCNVSRWKREGRRDQSRYWSLHLFAQGTDYNKARQIFRSFEKELQKRQMSLLPRRCEFIGCFSAGRAGHSYPIYFVWKMLLASS